MAKNMFLAGKGAKASNKKSSKNYNNIVIGSVINSIRAVVGGVSICHGGQQFIRLVHPIILRFSNCLNMLIALRTRTAHIFLRLKYGNGASNDKIIRTKVGATTIGISTQTSNSMLAVKHQIIERRNLDLFRTICFLFFVSL